MIEYVSQRKGEMKVMDTKGDRIHLEFEIPSRGIIGLRNNMLTATEGEAVMAHRFFEYQPMKGELNTRRNGALIAMETGMSIPFSIDKLQDRGAFHIGPNENIYEGQVVGEHIRQDDLVINVTKTKKMSNMRSSGADDKVVITPPIRFSLEEAMEYIRKDEYLEVTPESLRIRKILLSEHDRKRVRNSKD